MSTAPSKSTYSVYYFLFRFFDSINKKKHPLPMQYTCFC